MTLPLFTTRMVALEDWLSFKKMATVTLTMEFICLFAKNSVTSKSKTKWLFLFKLKTERILKPKKRQNSFKKSCLQTLYLANPSLTRLLKNWSKPLKSLTPTYNPLTSWKSCFVSLTNPLSMVLPKPSLAQAYKRKKAN